MPSTEAELSKAENLLKSLGIKTEARMGVLLKYFFREESSDLSTAGGLGALGEGEDEENNKVKPTDELLLFNTVDEVKELRSMISAEDVVNAVRTFIEDVSVGSAVGGRAVADTVSHLTLYILLHKVEFTFPLFPFLLIQKSSPNWSFLWLILLLCSLRARVLRMQRVFVSEDSQV